MADTPGETGGGYVSSMCEISPSDEVAIINNLMDRIKKLELTVSQLLATNVTANRLSDLSQQVGWVTGVEFMGKPGWTQTEYGSLIPPAGLSLYDLDPLRHLVDYPCNPYDSDGQLKQEMLMGIHDSDGVLQFGNTCKGRLSGTKVDQWDNASNFDGVKDYGIAHYDELSGLFTHSQNGVTWVGGQVYELEFNCVQAGWYLIGAHIDVYRAGGLADAVLYINNGQNTTTLNGLYTRGSVDASGELVSLSLCGLVSRAAGENIRASRSGTSLTTQQFHLHIIRLSGLTP